MCVYCLSPNAQPIYARWEFLSIFEYQKFYQLTCVALWLDNIDQSEWVTAANMLQEAMKCVYPEHVAEGCIRTFEATSKTMHIWMEFVSEFPRLAMHTKTRHDAGEYKMINDPIRLSLGWMNINDDKMTSSTMATTSTTDTASMMTLIVFRRRKKKMLLQIDECVEKPNQLTSSIDITHFFFRFADEYALCAVSLYVGRCAKPYIFINCINGRFGIEKHIHYNVRYETNQIINQQRNYCDNGGAATAHQLHASLENNSKYDSWTWMQNELSSHHTTATPTNSRKSENNRFDD